MRLTAFRALGVAALTAIALPASAAPITVYDAALATPGGWYQGAGNPNGGFKTVTDNGVQVALRAKQRQDPAVIHTATDVYNVEAGTQGTGGAPVNNARAWWNYEFGIDLSAAGLTLADVTTVFTLADLTAGASGTTDILTEWPDNDTWGAGGESAGNLQLLTDWSAQNSQNPVFIQFPPNDAPGYVYDWDNEHYYRMTLSVFGLSGDLLATNFIDIAVGDAVAPAAVPEPGTIGLMAAGLAGLVIARRRRAAASR